MSVEAASGGVRVLLTQAELQHRLVRVLTVPWKASQALSGLTTPWP